MAGHSRWANIKHQKGAADVKRGQMFTKLAREITVAARQGGGDPEANPRLRIAIERARDSNMPTDNIERAIKRATGGEGTSNDLDEATYEGYGPSGVAILMQILTDNRNRAASEVRSTMNRYGGTMGEAGSVAWIFTTRGMVTVETAPEQAEEVALKAIDAGADDFTINEGYVEIYCDPSDLQTVRQALEQDGNHVTGSEVAPIPNTTVPLEAKGAQQTLRLLDRLEDLEDVQRVYTNADFPAEVLEEYRVGA